MKKVGITLRHCPANGYVEPRDGLARDWYRFFESLGLQHRWVLLPNLGDDTPAYARAQGVEALILTGGDDVGRDLLRDTSEHALLAHAISAGWPVLGVCRGLQLIQLHFGGKLEPAPADTHVGQRHFIHLPNAQDPLPWPCERQQRSVNSYHSNRLPTPALPLRPWAFDEQGHCEAVLHADLKIAGVMWHPEREPAPNEHDLQLCSWLFE